MSHGWCILAAWHCLAVLCAISCSMV
jgi:hypothetical protein